MPDRVSVSWVRLGPNATAHDPYEVELQLILVRQPDPEAQLSAKSERDP